MANAFGLERHNMDSVLRNSGKDYIDFTANVETTFKKMSGLTEYWGGTLYNEIILKWNEVVPFLNAFMRNAGEAHNFMTGSVKLITEVDKNAIDRATVDIQHVTRLQTKDDDKLNSTTERMRKDRDDMMRGISEAMKYVDSVFGGLIDSSAHSNEFDRAKEMMEKNHRRSKDGLMSVYDLVNKNMTTFADGYDDANRKIGNAVNDTK